MRVLSKNYNRLCRNTLNLLKYYGFLSIKKLKISIENASKSWRDLGSQYLLCLFVVREERVIKIKIK